MALWLLMLAGCASPPTALDPVSWHAHAFLFGYLGAVVAGFLLTAVPNWTGRRPMAGLPLAALVALWGIGRFAVATSALWPPIVVAMADVSFLAALVVVVGVEIVQARKWRNLIVIALLCVLMTGNAVFHIEAARGAGAAQGVGVRLAVSAAVMMIAAIGGRITPAFTRNWLVKRGRGAFPSPQGVFDRIALLALAAALAVWSAAPETALAAAALLAAGVLHGVRLSRWMGWRTGADSLVWSLHVGYAFVPIGAFALGAAILWPEAIATATAQHVWMAGAIGVMTLAVMTRASLGHTGHGLTAGAATTVLYLALMAAVAARVLADVAGGAPMALYIVSGCAWLLAFGGFACVYGPILCAPRADG